MKCEQCNKEIVRGKWCSDRCRMANKRAPKPEHEQGEQPKPEQLLTQEMLDSIPDSVVRPTVNLALPGHPDYAGCCVKEEGAWHCG